MTEPMARNTTRQGAGFELDVMHYLDGCTCEANRKVPVHVGWRGFGFTSHRSSGSRGAVDVVAVAPDGGWVQPHMGEACGTLWIQCKITNPIISPAERRAVTELARRAGGVPIVAYRALDLATGRMRPHFRQLTGPLAKNWLFWEPGEDN